MPPEPGPYPQPDPEPQPEWPEDRLYELIVNKYNWLIMCDNTRLEAYFALQEIRSSYPNAYIIPDKIQYSD